jgi:hypothetical protein
MLDLLEGDLVLCSTELESDAYVARSALWPSILNIWCGSTKISRTLSSCALTLSYFIYPGALDSLFK